jgi:hypothetical protein
MYQTDTTLQAGHGEHPWTLNLGSEGRSSLRASSRAAVRPQEDGGGRKLTMHNTRARKAAPRALLAGIGLAIRVS